MNDSNTNITSDKQQKIKKLSIQLYKLCFDDGDEFVDFYFKKRYRAENHFTILQNDKPVAALQSIAYTMNFFGTEINFSYLSAICTHPDFRKQGLMVKLLDKTHKQLFADEIYAAFLIPADLWLFDVYGKNGYETVFYRSKKSINTCGFSAKNHCKIYEYTKENQQDAFKYFDQKMRERNCCIQHSFADFEIVCEDIYNSNGAVLIAENNSKIVGISFAIRTNGDIIITEHFAETYEISETLLKTISEKTKKENLILIEFPVENNCHAIGMIRIIKVETMLQLYAKAHPACKKTIFVNDSVISENSGCYTISNAKCQKTLSPDAENVWNTAQLAQFIFAEQMPYMSLMMNE
jgi:predicted acetyltransferase